jgi:hypothetical protein
MPAGMGVRLGCARDRSVAGRPYVRPPYLRLILLAAAIGIPAALLAALFLALVHWLEDRLWSDLPDRLGYDSAPWFLVIGLPVAGARSSSPRACCCPATEVTARSQGSAEG